VPSGRWSLQWPISHRPGSSARRARFVRNSPRSSLRRSSSGRFIVVFDSSGSLDEGVITACSSIWLGKCLLVMWSMEKRVFLGCLTLDRARLAISPAKNAIVTVQNVVICCCQNVAICRCCDMILSYLVFFLYKNGKSVPTLLYRYT